MANTEAAMIRCRCYSSSKVLQKVWIFLPTS